MELDLVNPIATLEEHQFDNYPFLFSTESDHMPLKNSLNFLKIAPFRQEAISLISQMQSSYKFDESISYLSVNYMDRFLSRKQLPVMKGKPWILRLVVTSCVSLAAKIKNIQFSLSDLRSKEEFIFDAETIQRMEILVLSVLNWRMRSITPFSFTHFFISLFKLKDPPLMQALNTRATHIIFKAQNEFNLLEFKPSIVSASALLLASHELFPLQFLSFEKSILSCGYVNNENLLRCFNAMEKVEKEEESMVDRVSSSRTPLTVLEWRCTESVKVSRVKTVMTEKRGIKRRRINGWSSYENSVKKSTVQRYY